jgi:hypothetical protein
MNDTTTRAQQACLAWISDPGHAWLAVSLDSEHGFPKAIDFASEYSYLDITGDNFAGIVFLEEDNDAPFFIMYYGIEPDVLTHDFDDTDHFIRNLPSAR